MFASMWGLASLISTPTSERLLSACIHGWEMILTLIIVTIFAYNEFDCNLCADSEQRQANNNPYILVFIIVGWITMVIDFIAYGILLLCDMFEEDAWDQAFGIIVQGKDKVEETQKYREVQQKKQIELQKQYAE